jgi:hypothetical protein
MKLPAIYARMLTLIGQQQYRHNQQRLSGLAATAAERKARIARVTNDAREAAR